MTPTNFKTWAQDKGIDTQPTTMEAWVALELAFTEWLPLRFLNGTDYETLTQTIDHAYESMGMDGASIPENAFYLTISNSARDWYIRTVLEGLQDSDE